MSGGNPINFLTSPQGSNGRMNEPKPLFNNTISIPTMPFLSLQGVNANPLVPGPLFVGGNSFVNPFSTSTTCNVSPVVFFPFSKVPSTTVNYGQNVFLSSSVGNQSSLCTSAVVNPHSVTSVVPIQPETAQNLTESHKKSCQKTSSETEQRNVVVIDDDDTEHEKESMIDEELKARQNRESERHPASEASERKQHDDQRKEKMVVAETIAEEKEEEEAENDCRPAPKIGRWEVISKNSKIIPTGNAKKTVNRTTPERLHQVLSSNSAIARKATADIIVELECKKLKSFIMPLLNRKLPKLQQKVLFSQQRTKEEEDELNQMYSDYLSHYVPLMDDTREKLIGKKFEKVETAICILTMLVRSFVAGFTVHKKRNYKVAGGSKVILQCHTLTKSKKNCK